MFYTSAIEDGALGVVCALSRTIDGDAQAERYRRAVDFLKLRKRN